jgi:tRNA (guanine-N7-)-methyltransferase
LHYPNHFGKSQSKSDPIRANTSRYHIEYKLQKYPESSHFTSDPSRVTVVDIGCGYGGLLFNMTEFIGEKYLALGMEIRDKVTNFVAERINVNRINSQFKSVNSFLNDRTQIFP